MNRIKLISKIIAFLTICCTQILIIGCSNDVQQESLQFSIKIQDGKLVSVSEKFKAKEGDTITFNIESDEEGTIHLHGYDIKVSVDSKKSSELMLVADSTGSFKLAMHPDNDVHDSSHGSDKNSEHKKDHVHKEEGDKIILGSLEIYPR